ncbi:MAG: glycosyltransferase family 2 protein [Ktedonobacteraceae bacterium]
MIKHPMVSIVIPCYNYGHFLSETLESVLAQTWQHWECIVVDDGSIDNTAQVAGIFQNRDPRIKYIHQHNQGVSAARNAGINACRGNYIQLLDADDKLEVQKLEKQVAYLERHPGVDIVYSDVRYFQENKLVLNADISKRRAFPLVSGAGDEIVLSFIRRNIMVINAPLVKISVFKNIGPFNQSLVGHEDWEYWLRCALAGRRFSYQDDESTHALVRVHPKSATQNVLPMLITNLLVREYLQTFQLTPDLHKENNYRIGMQHAKLAKYEISNGNFSYGIKHTVRAIGKARRDARIIVIILYLLIPVNFATQIVWSIDRLRKFLQAAIK